MVTVDDRSLAQQVSLKLDGADQPHVTYFEVLVSSEGLSGNIKYATPG